MSGTYRLCFIGTCATGNAGASAASRPTVSSSALEPQKRGPKPSPKNPLQAENAKLTRENARLHKKLRRAELIIDLQKKVSQILGITLPVLEESDDDEVNS